MFLDIYYCIRDGHDLRLVALAGFVCALAAIALVILVRQARGASAPEVWRWVMASGSAGGFGIWATHFVAMIGYDPGVVVGYALPLTIASLSIAMATTTAGLWLAFRHEPARWRWAGGAIVGLGIAAMHYSGLQAVELPGEMRWALPYVLASVVLAIIPLSWALSLALDRNGARSAAGSALLFASAILLLHFTGMAGVSIIPGGSAKSSAWLLSSLGMGIAVAGTAFGVLLVCLITALVSSRARSAIECSEREFKILVQGISDCAICRLDATGRVASWNPGAQRLKGYCDDEALGLNFASFYSQEEQAAGVPGQVLEAARCTGKISSEGWRYRKDGTYFWAHVAVEALRDERGALYGFAQITRDMTRFKESQDRLAELTDNLEAALSNMHQGLCLFGSDERLVIANDRVHAMFDITREECPAGTAFEEVFRLGLDRRASRSYPAELMDEVLARHRACIAQPGGGTLLAQLSESCTLSIAHRPMPGGGWVTTFDDVTERRQAELRIEHMALHDGLTGLPNRIHHTDSLEAEIRLAEQSGGKVAVVAVDLDRFKEVNDVHGHAIGDIVLRALADRVRSALQPGEHIARFGGDEFAAFKPFASKAELAGFVQRLHAALTTSVDLDGLAVTLGASIGVAIFPRDGQSREQVVNNADLAMYRAKGSVDRQICYYEQGMDAAVRVRRLLASDLRHAIARDELSLAFQVQKKVSSQEITGFEALLRWRHPHEGWIAHSDFIPIAEESGEILAIGDWVLRRACAEAAKWPQPWKIAVNLSPVQLMQADLALSVAGALIEAGLPPERLELEVTESALIADKARAMHTLRQIKALGVQIALDDFGTGYSSLDTLSSFPFDKIKIDRSFLSSDDSNQSRAIIRAVLALGRSLSVPVLAEGLETEEQLLLLQIEGCQEAQGYLWGRPVANPLDSDMADPIEQAA